MQIFLGKILFLSLGILLILSGIYNWEIILSLNPRKKVFDELFGKAYGRVMTIIIGIYFISLVFIME